MPSRFITNDNDIESFCRFLKGIALPLTLEWIQGRDRTGEQNRLMWKWAQEVADQLGDRTRIEVQHDWKLRHGVPIRRADSSEFRAIYDASIRPLSFEMKLKAMAIVTVTSEFTVRQMVQFLDTVERECRANGLHLTAPDPDLATYQARYRKREAA